MPVFLLVHQLPLAMLVALHFRVGKRPGNTPPFHTALDAGTFDRRHAKRKEPAA